MFEEYARVRHEGDGKILNLMDYLSSPGAGAMIARTRVAMGENDKIISHPVWFRSRVFPVPRWVSEDGQAFMGAHVRIGGGKPPAPRLHFLDDTSRTDELGRVYVGYVGPHLPNGHTN